MPKNHANTFARIQKVPHCGRHVPFVHRCADAVFNAGVRHGDPHNLVMGAFHRAGIMCLGEHRARLELASAENRSRGVPEFVTIEVSLGADDLPNLLTTIQANFPAARLDHVVNAGGGHSPVNHR